MADIYDNSEVDLAIARVQAALATSDLRAANAKLKAVNKSRTNYASRSNQSKAFKPNGVSSTKVSNFTYSSPTGPRKVNSFRADERGQAKPNLRANEMRAGERGQGRTAPKVAAKPASKVWNPSQDSVAAKGLKKLGKSLRKAYQGK